MDKKLKRALFPKRTSWVINKILMDTLVVVRSWFNQDSNVSYVTWL